MFSHLDKVGCLESGNIRIMMTVQFVKMIYANRISYSFSAFSHIAQRGTGLEGCIKILSAVALGAEITSLACALAI